MVQGGEASVGVSGSRDVMIPFLRMTHLLLLLIFLVFLLAARCPQVEEEGLLLLLELILLPLSLRLSLVIQHQIWIVMASAVGHHHRADGAGVDVLDFEEAFDHVDVLRLDILFQKDGQDRHKSSIHFNFTVFMPISWFGFR